MCVCALEFLLFFLVAIVKFADVNAISLTRRLCRRNLCIGKRREERKEKKNKLESDVEKGVQLMCVCYSYIGLFVWELIFMVLYMGTCQLKINGHYTERMNVVCIANTSTER